MVHIIFPEPTTPSAVSGVSPGRGLLIPLGYLHPGKCEHSGLESHPPLCNGRWMVFVVMRMLEYQARDWLRRDFVFANVSANVTLEI